MPCQSTFHKVANKSIFIFRNGNRTSYLHNIKRFAEEKEDINRQGRSVPYARTQVVPH